MYKNSKLLGGWTTNPSEKYAQVKFGGIFPKFRDENNTYLKPPAS